jgi:hypothetical protein
MEITHNHKGKIKISGRCVVPLPANTFENVQLYCISASNKEFQTFTYEDHF